MAVISAAVARPLTDSARSRRRASSKRTGSAGLIALATPALIWYGVLTVGPLVAMFYISLLRWPSLISPHELAGLENFRLMFADPLFWKAARNSAIQILVVLPVMMPLAFMLGYYVSLKPRGHRILRVFLFTPALLSIAAKSVIFISILAPVGLLNAALKSVGLGALAHPWLASPTTALATVIAVELWGGIGFTAILFSARLFGLNQEVLEAAEIDGAGHWRRMWGIAYPITKDYFGVLTMLHFIWVFFSSAGTILLLTRGGPGTSTTTLSFLVYQKAFILPQIGYSQAVGVVTFFVGIVCVLIIRRMFKPTF